MSSENESVSPPLNIEKCSLVLVDVAGTTTSINFVKDTLFPFILKQADAFLQSKWEEEAVKECIEQIKENDAELNVASAVELVKSLTEKESSNKGLKTLQGLIYKDGYEKGELKAHIFDDVPEAFENWTKSRHIAVYSTGSVDSQKLLFANTTAGDISTHIHKYFDQTIGPKTEADSYKKIAKETEIEPEEIVFITDDIKEATAAKSAGVNAVLINREGNPALPEDASKDFTVIGSFKDLVLEKTVKRKIEEEPTSSEAPPSKVLKTDSVETAEVPTLSEETTEKEVAMEVDNSVETTENKTADEETKTAIEKTAPEKTEPEEKTEKAVTTDSEMKHTESEEKTETDKVEADPEKVEEKAETSKKTELVEPEQVKEPETVATEKKVESPKTEDKTDTEENKTETVETEPSEQKDDSEKGESSTAEAKTPEEKKIDEERPIVEKATEEGGEKSTENGEEKVDSTETKEPTEEGEVAEEAAIKTDGKENKSVLANGVENGNKDESAVDNNTDDKESETAEVTNAETDKNDETEVKVVKKLEESAESKTVSVEV